MEFWNKNEKLHDKFAVLTFHETGKYKTFKQIDKEIAKLEKETWDGQKFPFPILLDASGQTPKKWGVNGYPAIYVIDPEGKLAYIQSGAGEGVEKFLSEKLGIKYEGKDGDSAGERSPVPEVEKNEGKKEDEGGGDSPRDVRRRPNP